MKKSILIYTVFLFSLLSPIYAQEADAHIDAFLAKIDGANIEELEKELDQGIKGLQSFMEFFKAPKNEPKSFKPEEEAFSDAFKIDTSTLKSATQQFNNIGFLQTYKEDKSYLKFKKISDDFWNKISLAEGMEDKFTPKRIHFKDGTSTTKGINDTKISFFWEEPWSNNTKVIDSIEIDYTITYTASYDSLSLNKNTKKLNYRDGKVKVKKLEKNHLYITVSDAYADGIYIRALNKDGKPLNNNSSSFSPTSDDKTGDGMVEMLNLLEKVHSKLKNDEFKDVAELKKYLKKNFSKLEVTKDKDGVRHLKFFFEGNIDTVLLYFKTEEKSITTPFTAINNNDFKNVLSMQTKEHIVFMDAFANEIFRINKRPLQRISERLFTENDKPFYLNITNKSLDSIEAIKVFESTNGLFFSQKKLEDGFLVFDENFKPLSEIEFSNVYNIDKEYTHALSIDKENYALDAKGNIKKIEGVSEIGAQAEGLLMAKLNGKFGFINASGKTIIPCIYNEVESFSEGLALVRIEKDKYGFIDKKGKIVIPLSFSRATSFNNGLALISNDHGYQLIDKKGNIVVNANSNGYAINGKGLERTYQLGDKEYDAFGKLISKEN